MSDYPAEGWADVPKPCPNCGQEGTLFMSWELEAKPIGDFSLAGAQMKVSAVHRAAVACKNCKMMQAGLLTGDVKVVDGVFVSGHFESVGRMVIPNFDPQEES